MQGKCWSKQEDQLLKDLYQQKNVKKWSVIATRINKTFQYSNKSGKQCRQRYHNSLAPFIFKRQWTEEEEEELFRLHDQLGNRWTQIAGKLPGRAHNCVKNRFYAEVRKSLRRINRWQKELKIKSVKVIRVEGIIKIIYLGYKTCNEPQPYLTLSKKCLEIKNKILFFNRNDPSSPTLRQEILDLYKSISTLTCELRSYRLGKNKSQEKEKQSENDIKVEEVSPSERDSEPIPEQPLIKKQEKSSEQKEKIKVQQKQGEFMINQVQGNNYITSFGNFSYPMYSGMNGMGMSGYDYFPYPSYYPPLPTYAFNSTDGTYQPK